MSDTKFTPGPWAVDVIFAGGELTGLDAEIAALDGCEPYGLAQYDIVSTVEMSGAKRRNPETKAFDVPVGRKVAGIVFDPRSGEGAKETATAHLIAAAPAQHGSLDEILSEEALFAWANEKGIGRDEYERRSAIISRAQAALKQARGEQ